MSIPGKVLLWNGPAHNQVWVIDKSNIRVAVPMEISINQVTEPSMEFSFDTVEYQAFSFMWTWDGWPRTATVMCLTHKDAWEVDGVMQVLAGLWGLQVCVYCDHTFSYHEQKGRCVKDGCTCRFWNGAK